MKNQAAFPSPGVVIPYTPGTTTAHQQGAYEGMSLRDYFAAKAMNGMIAGAMADGSSFDKAAFSVVSRASYRMVDAMLAERERAE